MPALTGPALVIVMLLALAGAQKLLDPSMTVGALRGLGLPSGAGLVRAVAALELVVALSALIVGGPVPWLVVSLSFLGFTAFVVAALRRGTMIGSCGCFGREDTPPHAVHVALNLVLAAVAAAVAMSSAGAPLDALADHPADGVALLAIATVSLWLLYAAYVELPRTLAAVSR
jgi:hypothetical protein